MSKRFWTCFPLSWLRHRAPTGLAADALQSGVGALGDEIWTAAAVYSKPGTERLFLGMGCGASEGEAFGNAVANLPQGGKVLGRSSMRVGSWELI